MQRIISFSSLLPVALALLLCTFPVEQKNESDQELPWTPPCPCQCPSEKYFVFRTTSHLDYTGTLEQIGKIGRAEPDIFYIPLLSFVFGFLSESPLALVLPPQEDVPTKVPALLLRNPSDVSQSHWTRCKRLLSCLNLPLTAVVLHLVLKQNNSFSGNTMRLGRMCQPIEPYQLLTLFISFLFISSHHQTPVTIVPLPWLSLSHGPRRRLSHLNRCSLPTDFSCHRRQE